MMMPWRNFNFIHTQFINGLTQCAPFYLFVQGRGGIEPPIKFSERGDLTYRISIFRRGLLGKEGVAFFFLGGGGGGVGVAVFT